MQPERAAELLRKVRAAAAEPDWMDGYLEALAARNAEAPDLAERVYALGQALGPQDPRREVLRQAFSGA